MEQEQFPSEMYPQMPPVWPGQPRVAPTLPAGKRELIFGAILLAASLLMVNCVLFAGFHLGFSIAAVLCILCSSGYLLSSGCKPTAYSAALLLLSLLICASFARTDDGFTKFVMVCFLFVSTNLGLSLMAGKNQFSPGGIRSLSDSFSTFFGLGFGQLPASCRGISKTLRNSGSVGQKSTSILLGLGIAVPILLILVPLLVQADAAFEGMLDYLPEFSVGEAVITAIFGFCFAYILYTRNTALKHAEMPVSSQRSAKGLSALTVNTVLMAVCLVYCAYLVSQLAYFTGGFAGMLPEDYTLAQYARRGFFEMAWLCAINLSVIIFSLSLCSKQQAAPVFTRCLCLFIGVVTLFFVAAASAKMLLYIDSYGLTRLRVLTQVVMVFFGIVTLLICIWLFVPKLPYMKAVLLTALVMGAAVSWADVDTQVARYNVDAYLDGRAETVDVSYLDSLGDGVVPHLVRLSEQARDDAIAAEAATALINRWCDTPEDFRGWNYVNHVARQLLPSKEQEYAAKEEVWQLLSDITVPEPEYIEQWDTHGGFHGDGLFFGAASFSFQNGDQLSEQMRSSSMWHPLPLNSDLERLLYGSYSDTESFHPLLTMDGKDTPQIQNGYYFFYDRHSDSTDPSSTEGIFLRASYNLNLAIFDTDTNTLYYWELDT